MDLRQSLRFPHQSLHGSRGSSGVSKGESDLVSCGDILVRSPLELDMQCQASCRVDIGPVAFSPGATGLSHLPSCFESILGDAIESVKDIQVYLEWIRTSGSFGMVARPLECLRVSR